MNWDAFASFRFFVSGTVARPGSSAMIRNSRTSDSVNDRTSESDLSISAGVFLAIRSKSCASLSSLVLRVLASAARTAWYSAWVFSELSSA